MNEKPSLHFEEPRFGYSELEQQLHDYRVDPDRYAHDVPSVISIAEGIRARRMGNVAVGGCLYKHDDLIFRDVSKAVRPYHRTDLHAEIPRSNSLTYSTSQFPFTLDESHA